MQFLGRLRDDLRLQDALTFELFIHDERYSVPTLRLISANGEAEARTIAEAVLGEGPHHLGVELCLEGARLLSLGSVGAARPSSEGSSAA